MKHDAYLRGVLTIIAGTLLYLCVLFTPVPVASAQEGRDRRPSASLPLPWATTPAASFVARPARLGHSLEATGFVLESWRDTSRLALQWCRDVAAHRDDSWSGSPSQPEPHASNALANLAHGIEEGRHV